MQDDRDSSSRWRPSWWSSPRVAARAPPSSDGQDRDICRRHGRRRHSLRCRQDRGTAQPHRHPSRLGELRPDDHATSRPSTGSRSNRTSPTSTARPRSRRRRTWPAPAASPTSSTSRLRSPWPTPTSSHRTRWPPGPISPTPTRSRPGSGPTITPASRASPTTRASATSPRSPTSPIPSTRARSPSTATRSRPGRPSTASSWPHWPTADRPTTSRPVSTSSRS